LRDQVFVFIGRLVLAFSAAALAVAAQSLAVDKQADLVIRSTTRLVQMSVVAQDKHGRPVVDLKKEDFQVFDKGKLRPITVFVVEAAGITSQPQSAPRDTFTNQFARTTGARSAYAVVLLDWLNTGWSDQARARQQVVQMLDRIERNDRVALYVLDRRLRVISEFGDNTATLLEKLATLRGDPIDWGEAPAASIYDASVSSLGGALFPNSTGVSHPAAGSNKEEQMFLLDQRVRETLMAFQEIAAHLASVPGRKTLIWVSAGFPLKVLWSVADGAVPNERDYNAEIGRTIQKLNDADVAVYPIDARGLTASASAYDTIWTMKEFALRTGGLAWYNHNDLDVGMRNALDDIRFSYTIGFLPPEEASNGFHNVRVNVRRPGVSLHYREGYYLDEPSNSHPQDQRTEVVRAMASPVDSTAVPITVRAARNRDTLMLQISLDAGSLNFVREADRWQGKLEIQARFEAADGGQIGSITSKVVEFNMLPQTYGAALRNGLPFHIYLQIPPDATALKELVWDVRSGKIGTLSIPLKMVTEN